MSKRKFYQKKRVMIPLVIGAALIFLGIFGAFHSSMYQTTTNAYIDEYLINMTPKFSGKIVELNIDNNSTVKKGEIVLELDGSRYSQKITMLEKEFEEIQEEIKNFDNEITQLSKKNEQIKVGMEIAKVNLENANGDYVRYKNEFKDGTVTKKDLNNAIKNLETAQDQYEEAQNNLKTLSNNLNEMILKKDSQMDIAREVLENLENAKFELSNATITAPKSGKIVDLKAKVGEMVNSDNVLFSILPDECFVIAGFKKIKDAKIKVGQKALVKIYSAGFSKMDGVVVEILPEKNNVSYVKIKIKNNVERYNLKSGAKAYVRMKVR